MKYFKKVILVILLLPILFLTSCSEESTTSFYDTKTIGSTDYNIYYNSKTGEYSASIREYSGTDQNLVIPDTITYEGNEIPVFEIRDSACSANSNTVSATIGANITKIGYAAFMNSKNLSTVTLNEGLTYIDGYAFSKCPITSITIPESLKTLSVAVFINCSSLKSVVILSKDVSIGSAAFYNTSIEETYFYGNSEEFSTLSISSGNDTLTNSTIYYYSEEEISGNYWHYVDGVVTKW